MSLSPKSVLDACGGIGSNGSRTVNGSLTVLGGGVGLADTIGCQEAAGGRLAGGCGGQAAAVAGGKDGAKGRRQRFLKGPVCLDWLTAAGRAGPAALRLGLALWAKAGFERDNLFKEERVESRPIDVRRNVRKLADVSSTQVSRGLKALEAEGLVRVVKGGPGRCPVVVIVNKFLVGESS